MSMRYGLTTLNNNLCTLLSWKSFSYLTTTNDDDDDDDDETVNTLS